VSWGETKGIYHRFGGELKGCKFGSQFLFRTYIIRDGSFSLDSLALRGISLFNWGLAGMELGALYHLGWMDGWMIGFFLLKLLLRSSIRISLVSVSGII
jgi:hypothetical protein